MNWMYQSTERINKMTFDEACEIIENQINLGHSTGDFRPREHMTKALEIILEQAKNKQMKAHYVEGAIMSCSICGHKYEAYSSDFTHCPYCGCEMED